MKFTYVGHACAIIEHQGKRLLFDPWLAGPVYWGAWWHFPHAKFDPSIFDVDFIYITHWHFDHMHAESLAKFNKKAELLLPKFPVSGLPGPLRDMGFSNITELANGETFELVPGFRLTSYQIQLQDDSTAIVQCDVAGREPVTIVNLNDSKPLPSTWKRIHRRFPQVDMMLRSHSPAWAFPSAYSFEDPTDAVKVGKETYKQAFWTAAEKLKPRYAVAFASGVCHLTDDTLSENDNLVLAGELLAYCKQNPLSGTEAVYLPPGTTYTPENGFSMLTPPPDEKELASFLKSERTREKTRLEEIEREIDGKKLTREVFDKYFHDLKRRSWPLWLVMKACWRFDVSSSSGEKTFWYDFRSGKTFVSPEQPSAKVTTRFWIKEGILAEALETMCFSNISVAKRWKVWIAKGELMRYFLIDTFNGFNEAGYSRLSNLFNFRMWWGILLRLDEFFDYSKMAFNLILRGKEAALPPSAKRPSTGSSVMNS